MKHDEAIRSKAAERYVAHELSPAEQEAFEEHFFDCPACADEVRFALAFAANVRAISGEQLAANAGGRRKWRERLGLSPTVALSFAANLVLAAGLGYVLLMGVRRYAVPRFTQIYFAPGPAHGAADVHSIPPAETFYAVRFPAPSVASLSYSYEILDAAGKRERSGSLAAPPVRGDDLYLQVPVDSLPAGIHTLVVRDSSGSDMVSWSKFQTSH